MAGSGEGSRVGNIRGLNAMLGCAITSGLVNPQGDLVGALSAATPTVGTSGTTISCAASGGGAVLTKAIPDDAVLLIADVAGAVDTMELVLVNGAAASGAASVTIDTHYWSVAHAAGSPIFLLSSKRFMALITATTAPTDNGLGSEYAQTGYARQPALLSAPTAADPPVTNNPAAITWGPLTGATGSDVVTYGQMFDALSGGTAANTYGWWTWAATRTPNAGDSLQIAGGAFTHQLFH